MALFVNLAKQHGNGWVNSPFPGNDVDNAVRKDLPVRALYPAWARLRRRMVVRSRGV